MKKLLLVGLLVCFSASSSWATIEVEGHPLIEPYPGSTVWESRVGEFDRVEIPEGIFSRQGPKTVFAQSDRVEGKVTGITYHTPRERTALDYNKALSMRRAAAVVGVLTADYGIDSSRLHSEGIGPLAPVLANTSEAGRAKNRRVELVRQ